MREKITDYNPKAVLIPALSVRLFAHYAKVAKIAKDHLPNAITVIGGVYATTCYDYIAQDKNMDFIFMGHAEERLSDFLKTILSPQSEKMFETIPGIGYRTSDGDMVINPTKTFIGDLNKMAKPNYSKVNLSPYIKRGFHVGELPIITSYGCVHNCLFCATRTINGRKIAYREIDDVLEEMKYLKDTYKIDSVCFLDDNILAKKDRALELFERMQTEGLNLKFRLMSTAAWHLDEEILDAMVGAGCYGLTLSIESGTDRVLHQIIRKPLKKEIVPPAIKMCQERGIFVTGNIIIGFPGETWNEIRQTIAFGEQCNPDYLQIFMATILPQTDLYKLAKETGCIPKDFSFFNDTYGGFSRGSITTDEFIPEELEILRSYEWDRINFSSEEKRKKFCKYRDITDKELVDFRKSARRSTGTSVGLRK